MEWPDLSQRIRARAICASLSRSAIYDGFGNPHDGKRARIRNTLAGAKSDKIPWPTRLRVERSEWSEPLGMQQRENQISQEADGNEGGERIVKDHDSTPFDGVGIGDRKCEEAKRDRNHQNVQHGNLPCALDCCCSFARSGVTL